MTAKIMGVLNLTPDSFFPGSRVRDSEFLSKLETLVIEGAEVVDLGPQSTRPGAEILSPSQELERLKSFPLKQALNEFPEVHFSLDSYHYKSIQFALNLGFTWINDVSCASNPKIFQLIKEFKCKYVLMHSRGDSQTMGMRQDYKDLVSESAEELKQALENMLSLGISKDQIVVDPGIGFAKSPEQNWTILSNLGSWMDSFKAFQVLVGVSRKSLFNVPFPGSDSGDNCRKEASLAVAFYMASLGVDFIRVHDVKSTMNILKVLKHLGK